MSRERPPRFGLINDGKREEYLSVLRGVAVQWQSLDERKMEKSRKADSSRDKGKKGESRVGDHFLESMQQHAACYVVESPNFLKQ